MRMHRCLRRRLLRFKHDKGHWRLSPLVCGAPARKRVAAQVPTPGALWQSRPAAETAGGDLGDAEISDEKRRRQVVP
jgi:hypothetical protein